MLYKYLSLAAEGLVHKRRKSVLIFLILTLSFAFAILSISLVSSMGKTNQESLYDTFGEWYFAIPSGMDEDLAWFEAPEQSWVEQLGTTRCYGTVAGADSSFGFGTMDQAFISLGRIGLEEGRFPKADNEIAMEADSLAALGYDYTLGQEITLPIQVSCGEGSVTVTQSYILTGLLKEYSGIWMLDQNKAAQLLVSACVTETAAEQVLELARDQVSAASTGLIHATPQYFLSVPKENWSGYSYQLQVYLVKTRLERPGGDTLPSTNRPVLQLQTQEDSENLYIVLIALVAGAAVFCTYMMQLPADVQSFATLRSIGGTRSQLTGLLLLETLYLWFPAVLSGILLGGAGTWLALRLAVFTGNINVYLSIPYKLLFGLFLIWAAVILLARLLTLCLILWMPLSGRFGLKTAHIRRLNLLRNGVLVFLFGVVCFSVLQTSIGAIPLLWDMEKFRFGRMYSVTVTSARAADEGESSLLTPAEIQQFRALTNAQVLPSAQGSVFLSFPGLEERSATLCIIENPADYGSFQLDQSALNSFAAGELVLVCLPDRMEEYQIENDPILGNPPLPDGEVTLRFSDTYQIGVLTEDSVGALLQRVPLVDESNLPFSQPYTVVCSPAYLEKVLAQMPPDGRWGHNGEYRAGSPAGFTTLNFLADVRSVNFASDTLLATFSSKLGLLFSNERTVYLSVYQQRMMSLIVLGSSGICITIVALMIAVSILALEAENESRSLSILRSIGMSRRQGVLRIFGKALARSLAALVLGGVCYEMYSTYMTQQKLEQAIAENAVIIFENSSAFSDTLRQLETYGFDWTFVLFCGVFCMGLFLLLSLLAKLRLTKVDLLRSR